MNSDGCIEAKPSEYQRVAPFPKSVPKSGKNAKDTNAIPNAMVARRLIVAGANIEVMIIATRERPPKTACLST
ncbi:Uncharacterised protein [marine metagenome]